MGLQPPDQEGLRSLAALAATGSVTAAAARRHLSQPALTRQLQRLAQSVGVPLLERRGRGVVLTEAGEALVGMARRQAADWEATAARLQGAAIPPLRLGCGATLALSLLPRALARIRRQAPDLPLRIAAGDSATTAARVLSGEIDAGLVTTMASHPQLAAEPLAADAVLAVSPPEWPPVRTLKELAEGALCLYSRGTGFRSMVDELLASYGLFPTPVTEMDSMEALRELVAAGLGRSLLPRSVVAPALAAGRLQGEALPELAERRRTITLLRHAGRAPHPAMDLVREALHAAAGSWGAEGGGLS